MRVREININDEVMSTHEMYVDEDGNELLFTIGMDHLKKIDLSDELVFNNKNVDLDK
jgi:hypothetical protein